MDLVGTVDLVAGKFVFCAEGLGWREKAWSEGKELVKMGIGTERLD